MPLLRLCLSRGPTDRTVLIDAANAAFERIIERMEPAMRN